MKNNSKTQTKKNIKFKKQNNTNSNNKKEKKTSKNQMFANPISNMFHSIIISCILVLLLLIPAYHFFIPHLLNYPTNAYYSKTFAKYLTMSQPAYISLLFLVGLLLTLIVIRLNFNELYKYKKYFENKTKLSEKDSMNLHMLLFRLPFKMFYSLTFTFGMYAFIFHSLQIQYYGENSIKLLLLIFSFIPLFAGFVSVYAKKLSYHLLEQIPNTIEFPKEKRKQERILSLIFSNILFMSLSFITIICFSQFNEVSKTFVNSYNYERIQSDLKSSNPQTYEKLINCVKETSLTQNESMYLITPSNEALYMAGDAFPFTQFGFDYIEQYPNEKNTFFLNFESSRVGTYVNYKIGEDIYKVAIIHKLDETSFFYYLMTIECILLILTCYIWYNYCCLFTKRIKEVLYNYEKLAKKNHVPSKDIIIKSNDEFGELCFYFNKLRAVNKKNYEIKKQNEEFLLQKEKFTSLGHLVGGISHNLKTPIMSIAGATEGLSDLIKEYDTSIDDNSVTAQDHHDIAKDMNKWNEKIQSYTSYMSDVITALKDETTTLPDEMFPSFTLDELLKRLTIITKYDLTTNSVTFINNVLIDLKYTINGNINSLIQVLEALIENSIEAYKYNCPDKEKIVELITYEKNNNIIFSVKDYAGGIPENIQEKIFKEMITTKGKFGTGLGLYVANSNIEANFNGKIKFSSEIGVGSSFNIIIPINLNK